MNKKGFKILSILIIISFISFFISKILFTLSLLAILFIAFFFRDFSREIIPDKTLVSPIDGKVIAIDKINNQTKIYVKVGILNSHIIRAVTDSNNISYTHKKGLNIPINLKTSKLNEKAEIIFKRGIKLELIDNCFNIDLNIKDNIFKGQRIGFFSGGLAIISLSKSYQTNLKIGDNIKANTTILA